MDQISAMPDLNKANEILGKLARPQEIIAMRAELGEDSSGQPALWIILQLAPNAIKERSDIKKITDFGAEVQIQLIQDGVGAFPYLKVEEAA